MRYKSLQFNNPHLFSNENALLSIVTDKDEIEQWVKERKLKLASEGKPESWAEIGIVFQDPYILILRDLVRFPSGSLGSYIRLINQADLRGGQGVVILPLYQNKIVLLRQYRHPVRSWSWEVPRGFGEPDTPAEDNAKKELAEEIGAEVKNIVDLDIYYNNTGMEGNVIRLFYAELSTLGAPNTDEGIEAYHLFDLNQFEQMIANAEITDGFTIAAYTRAKLKGLL
jgi:ADP-ribose pyrophosphatase